MSSHANRWISLLTPFTGLFENRKIHRLEGSMWKWLPVHDTPVHTHTHRKLKLLGLSQTFSSSHSPWTKCLTHVFINVPAMRHYVTENSFQEYSGSGPASFGHFPVLHIQCRMVIILGIYDISSPELSMAKATFCPRQVCTAKAGPGIQCIRFLLSLLHSLLPIIPFRAFQPVYQWPHTHVCCQPYILLAVMAHWHVSQPPH